MAASLCFQHALISTDQAKQTLQELVYSRIAAAWTAGNPKYPVLFASEAILAIVRGLHDGWRSGTLSGDEVARQLAGLFDQDWAQLAQGELITRDSPQSQLAGFQRPDPRRRTA